MAGRGVLTVDDLRARSQVDPVTGCWHWQGAKSACTPRIHTFDYAAGDKRVMSGPAAVWNIAHGDSPGRYIVFRRCLCHDCVNPVHMGRARDRAEIGLHIARSGKRQGTAVEARRANIAKAHEARGIVPTPADVVLAIRSEGDDPTNLALAAKYGLRHTTISRIRRGDSHRHLLPAQTQQQEAAAC